uniref:MSP domain-containing protein n=1 Tax=Caenorhabditis tropicalis TaxID=1561998 RepID=A0A1I7UNW9_9PELO
MVYREPGREIKVPLNGSTSLEVKNLHNRQINIEIQLMSSRMKLVDGKQSEFDRMHIYSCLKPEESIVFRVKDGGTFDLRSELESISEEGTLRIRFNSSEGSPSFRHILPDIQLTLDPETDSFKELRMRKHSQADWLRDSFCHLKEDDKFPVEEISESKYSNGYPETVKVPMLTEEDKKWNEEREREIGMKRKERLESVVKSERERGHKRRLSKDELRRRKIFILKAEELKKKTENRSKNSETNPPEKTLKDPEASVKSVKSTKKSERSEKRSEKSMKNPETSVKRSEKSETSAITSKRSENRSETGEASEYSKSVKSSTTKVSISEISEGKKKEEKSMIQMKEKKKKKKRRCIIS